MILVMPLTFFVFSFRSLVGKNWADRDKEPPKVIVSSKQVGVKSAAEILLISEVTIDKYE